MIRPRRTVDAMEAYRPPLEGRRSLARLDFNENTAGPPVVLPSPAPEELAAYPEYGGFLAGLADRFGVSEACLLPVNGSGEALFLTAFAFVEPGADRALTSRPTFSLIPHNLEIVGADLVEVDATADFRFDVTGLERELAAGPKLAVFASPDNPTGAVLPAPLIRDWCARFPETLFVLDEAYAEYGPGSMAGQAPSIPNLLVLRTFSKAWGLAGLRVGVVIGPPPLVEILSRVRCPYSVNAAAVAAVTKALPMAAQIDEQARALLGRKETLAGEVEAMGVIVVRGNANFLLLGLGPEAAPFVEFCRGRGVLIRDRSGLPGMTGRVRVTVGTAAENDAFLAALDAWRRQRALIFDMDGTLVDTSRSFDATVTELVARRSEKPLVPGEIQALRRQGGFNDDWDAAIELLRRRGVTADRDEIAAEGVGLYLTIARDAERLLSDEAVLRKLGKRYRLFVYTGRTRPEYAPVWGEAFDPFFEEVLCRDDDPALRPKPAPDGLLALMKRHGIEGGFYVGDSVDDMVAAKNAGLTPVGVAATQGADALDRAGAEILLDTIDRIEGVFLP